MDLSPTLDRFADHFGGRASFLISEQAASLWRYRLENVMSCERNAYLSEASRLAPSGLDMKGPKALFLLQDDPPTSGYCDDIEAAFLERSAPYGIKVHRCYDFTHGNAPIPYKILEPTFMNAYLIALHHMILEDAGSEMTPAQQNGTMPIIWTSEKERAAAGFFFTSQGLDPLRTVGIHLTAGSHNVYKDIWPKECFEELARKLVSSGLSILLLSGKLTPNSKSAEADLKVHRDFAGLIGSDRCRFFSGDTLEQAEIIRKCAVFFSAETGPAHLASATGTPKVTIAYSNSQKQLFMMTTEKDAGFVRSGYIPFKLRPHPNVDDIYSAIRRIVERPGI